MAIEPPNNGEDSTVFLYAWLCRDLADGIEGPIIYPLNERGVPLITTNRDQALRLTPVVQGYVHSRGVSARLVQFDRSITLQTEEVRPRRSSRGTP